MRPHHRLAFALVLPVVIVLAGLAGSIAYQASIERRAAPGRPAPAFTLATLDGHSLDLESLRGQMVLLNFWASWCGPCRDEAPALQRFHETYGDRVAVIGVNYREAEDHARPFVESFGLTFPIARDWDGRVARAYGLRGVPESWLIDPDGVARLHWPGPMTYEQMEAAYRQTLEAWQAGGGAGRDA